MRNTEKLNLFVHWMAARNMAKSTIKIYNYYLIKFFNWANEDSCRISDKRIQEYILNIPPEKSFSYKNQAINAIRLYFKIAEKRRISNITIPRPKSEQLIPNILTEDQAERVIFNTKNLKHKAILFAIYDNGLRISELINLTLMDLRTKCENPHIIIRHAKHHASRIIPISTRFRELIKEYYLKYRPKEYLFEGEGGEKQYSETSIRNTFNAALRREKIYLRIRVHDLRHSFATHCLAHETDIYHLAQILGHKSVKTTERTYSHLSFNQIIINRPETSDPKSEEKEFKLKICG
jgi:integrase/recombinase XerD